MLGHRELTMEDYVDILRRRFWLIVTRRNRCPGDWDRIDFRPRPKYQSQTLILVEQQKVPEDYVKPVVAEDLERASGIDEGADPEPFADRADHKAIQSVPQRQSSMDDRVELTQKAIGVKPIPAGAVVAGMPGFYITFVAQNAQTAQQVCTEIASLFVSENLSARQESAEGTTDS